MRAIRAIGGWVLAAGAVLAAAPVCAQSVPSPVLVTALPVHSEIEGRGDGWRLRAVSTVRTDESGAADTTRTSYRFSVQRHLLDRAWLGLTAMVQGPRFDTMRGEMRATRPYAGARLSLEAAEGVEFGFSWMKRLRGRMIRGAPKRGPTAFVQFRY